jgi:hypothetical protein
MGKVGGRALSLLAQRRLDSGGSTPSTLGLRGSSLLYANRTWEYPYRKLFSICSKKKLLIVTNQIAKQYSRLTSAWNEQLNSEWTCRSYVATKMILNATVLVNSLDFARLAGLRTANPYYEYYATLSLLRGVVFLTPTVGWQDGALMSISHSKAINIAFDWIARLDKQKAAELKSTTLLLKAQRELIAYKAPASGDRNLGGDYDLIELLTILAEVAEFNSELLEASVTKNADPSTFVVLDEHVHQIARPEVEGYTYFDSQDCVHLDYLRRKMPRPYHLGVFMHPGQSEDFVCAWDGDDGNTESFTNGSPANWQVIFDVP